MKKQFWILLVLFLLLLAIGGYFFIQGRLNDSKDSVLVYNEVSGSFEAIDAVPRVALKEVDPNPNEDGLHNRTLLRGYFDSYDKANNTITIKSVLPFTGDTQYELVSLQLPPTKTTYCAPSTVVDQQTGERLITQNLGFIVKNGQTLVTTHEQVIPFEQFITEANQTTYLFVQLTADYDETQTNYIQKLVVVGLCD